MSSLSSVIGKPLAAQQTQSPQQSPQSGQEKKLQETVAVVVIHGVGEAVEGWIDSGLIPRMQTWLAYGGLEKIYDPKAIGSEADKPTLVIEVQCGGDESKARQRWISVSLDNDRAFESFCKCVGLEQLLFKDEYAGRDQRFQNRDQLIDEVWDKIYEDKSVRSEDLLKKLHAANVPAAYAFCAESSVSRVRDPEKRGDPAATWRSFTRAWESPSHKVIVTEMFWADLSYGGGIILQRLLSMIELFLEAPFVLGRAFVGDSEGLLDKVIAKLILAANWLMRWPLAGLNAAIFACCFTAVVLSQFGRLDLLPIGVIATLLLVANAGRKAMLAWRHEKPGLSDLGLTTMVCSVALAAIVALWCLVSGEWLSFEPQATAVSCLNISVRIILGFWFFWSTLNVAGVIIVSLVAAGRYLVWLYQRLFDQAKAPDSWKTKIQPLARPGAAIGVGVLIGIIWKLVLSALGLLIIPILADTACKPQTNGVLPPDMSIIDIVFNLGGNANGNACQLVYANQHLSNVLVLNFIAALGVGLAVIFIVGWRQALKEIYPGHAQDGTLVIPRLIAHPVLIAMLFAVSCLGFEVFYVLPFGQDKPSSLIGRGLDFVMMPPSVGLALFAFAMALVAEFSSNIIHIGRDLVDHQYYRNETTRPAQLYAMMARWAGMAPEPEAKPDPNGPAGEKKTDSRNYIRRMRIQRRLEALIEEVIRYQEADRIVFFAHSQGTVILHDYLLNTNDAFAGDLPGRESLKKMRIDVLTIGSPLKHIYRYYYDDYSQPDDALSAHGIICVDSWTNMWRIDDPIGQDVHDMPNIKQGSIVNIGIPPGGHTDYWRDGQVCRALWALIEGRDPVVAVRQGPMADELKISHSMPPLASWKMA